MHCFGNGLCLIPVHLPNDSFVFTSKAVARLLIPAFSLSFKTDSFNFRGKFDPMSTRELVNCQLSTSALGHCSIFGKKILLFLSMLEDKNNSTQRQFFFPHWGPYQFTAEYTPNILHVNGLRWNYYLRWRSVEILHPVKMQTSVQDHAAVSRNRLATDISVSQLLCNILNQIKK